MNQKEAYIELLKVIGGYPEIKLHESFVKDLKELLDNELKGKEIDFFKQLITQLNNIKQFKTNIITINGHEILSKTHVGEDTPLYSIHINKGNKFNIRLLMVFQNENPIFLCAFYEKSGKKRTGYDRYIKISQDRYANLIGGI